MKASFPAIADKTELETTDRFAPRFDRDGLVTAIVVDAGDGALLMVARMNAEAIARTIETGRAWFYSRSRRELWEKGATSGERFEVTELRTDCDQDALLMKVRPLGKGAACHTGRRSCFYRRVVAKGGSVTLVAD
jgi:phosphoribosyl-AMP cyclohydrolase